ncbi:MAG: Gfo/Idh/MocA family oxidoreductase [Chloroflexota bacterium]|nr:Gfo/Idh/MocA family oxidoreductase [Chloroflexota bacterium]
MAKQIIRFGVIGAGLMGREFAAATARWGSLLDLEARPEIVALCDTNPALFEWYTSNFPSIRTTTTDYHELLASNEIDAIYCAVPHSLHAGIYTDIIRAGKHLFGEKPFGIDLEANAKIMAAVRERPEVLVRVSSEFPFYPGAQRIVQAVLENRLGRIIEVRSGFLHSSDLDPNKPINWKRMVEFNGEYGCMGDLGMHAVHLPFRFGWTPLNVRALLSNIVTQRPDKEGNTVPCETWDNAILATEVETQGYRFPMTIETKRISPGDTDTWYLDVLGTEYSISFSTRHPRTLRLMEYQSGQEQAWQSIDLGYRSAYRTVTDGIFEFGFADSILQMWAAFVDELAHRDDMLQPFTCATPEEAELSHRLFTAALESERTGSVLGLESVGLASDGVT